MSWIKSFQELREHPKAKRAARLLGIKKIHLIGHLQGIWWWTLSYAEDGCLAGYANQDIAEAAEWDGDPDELVQALVTCGINGKPGFLEYDDAGHLWVHDWEQYTGKLIERRATERERQRNKRNTDLQPLEDVGATLAQHTQDVGATLLPRSDQIRVDQISVDIEGAGAPSLPEADQPKAPTRAEILKAQVEEV